MTQPEDEAPEADVAEQARSANPFEPDGAAPEDDRIVELDDEYR